RLGTTPRALLRMRKAWQIEGVRVHFRTGPKQTDRSQCWVYLESSLEKALVLGQITGGCAESAPTDSTGPAETMPSAASQTKTDPTPYGPGEGPLGGFGGHPVSLVDASDDVLRKFRDVLRETGDLPPRTGAAQKDTTSPGKTKLPVYLMGWKEILMAVERKNN